MSAGPRAGRGETFRDLDDLEAAELAEEVASARDGSRGAGAALFAALAGFALEGRGRRRRALGPFEAAEVLALLGLTPRPKGGRRPKAGPGSRAAAAARLRSLARFAALASAPSALLGFYSDAAAAIEAGADPARALALRKRSGRPLAEGPITQAARDFLTDLAFRRARKAGATRDDALELAGAELGSETGRGRSAESARRARRRLRNPPSS